MNVQKLNLNGCLPSFSVETRIARARPPRQPVALRRANLHFLTWHSSRWPSNPTPTKGRRSQKFINLSRLGFHFSRKTKKVRRQTRFPRLFIYFVSYFVVFTKTIESLDAYRLAKFYTTQFEFERVFR